MKVCSPKDGFVIDVHVRDGDIVSVGQQLLNMDLDEEARDEARLDKMENIRKQMAAQYEGPELDLSRHLAEISVKLAKEAEKLAATILHDYSTYAKGGT